MDMDRLRVYSPKLAQNLMLKEASAGLSHTFDRLDKIFLSDTGTRVGHCAGTALPLRVPYLDGLATDIVPEPGLDHLLYVGGLNFGQSWPLRAAPLLWLIQKLLSLLGGWLALHHLISYRKKIQCNSSVTCWSR